MRTSSFSAARRPLARLAVTATTAVALIAAGTPAAQASVAPLPDDTGVVSGAGYALAAAGDRTILGGKFTRFGGALRSNVAAVLPNGSVDPTFIADTNGKVEAVATSTDGRTVFIGGTFTTVNGVPRANLAAVDSASGAVLTDWSADTGGTQPTVMSLAVHGDQLFVGGKFNGIDGVGRKKLAAVGAADGNVIRAFDPGVNGLVREVVVAPDGATVYVGGGFTRLGGMDRSNAGSVLATTGAVTAFNPVVDSGTGVVTVALSPDGSRFFLSTQNNFVRAYDPATSDNPVWSTKTSGNTQAIAASSAEVYMGGHWSGFQDGNIKRPYLGSVRMSDGKPTTWDPKCLGDKMGVWALLIQGDKLHAAGVFRSFGTDAQRGYARFSGAPTP